MKKDGKAISIWVDLDTAAKVSRIAKKLGITNSQLLKNVALCGLDDAEVLEKMGMLSLATLIQKTKERVDTLIEEGKRRIAEG